MTLIIIKGSRKWKGRNVTEMARNLEGEGWPTEFRSEEDRDKVAFIEKKEGRPLKRSDLPKIDKL